MSWEKVTLGDICKVYGGTTPSTSNGEYWDGKTVWLSPTDLPEIGEIVHITNSARKITVKAINETSITVLPKGAVVYSTRASIGKIGIAEVPLTTNQGFVNFVCNGTLFNKFLCYTLKYFTPQIANLSNSTTFSEVNRTSIKNFRIPLPPISVQQKIAGILDKADDLRKKDQQLLAKYDELLESIFYDMFGDPVKNEKGWEKVNLKALIREDDKINYGVVQPGDDYEGGIPIIRVGDLEEMMVNKSNLKRISPDIEKNYKRSRIVGDEILVGCVGSIGTIALADESLKGFNIVRATARVRIDEQKANRLYIANHLNTSVIQNYFIKETRTVSQPTLNISHIEETPILVPPITIQNQFATIAQNIQQQKQLVKQQIEQSENLFQSLLQRAFKGELVK
jgi:type I restriction enzyme S subunit